MRFIALIGLVTLLTPFCAFAESGPPEETSIDRGAKVYTNHCAGCHGASGVGDGSLQPFLMVKVPDLTQLSLNRGGTYPKQYVEWIIDGRSEVIAHGPREMPIWGNVFRYGEGLSDIPALKPQNRAVREKISDLVDYVETLQAE